jgi:hypothetical protein
MTHADTTVPEPATRQWQDEIDAERTGWRELVELVRRLTPAECLEPGYYRDPDWTVRDVVAHVGTWLAQAEVQLERMVGGTYEGHNLDIDAVNAQMLEAVRDQPMEVAWTLANAARTRMLQDWYPLRDRNDEAVWWVNKAGGVHYGEHLPRLREWVAELVARR